MDAARRLDRAGQRLGLGGARRSGRGRRGATGSPRRRRRRRPRARSGPCAARLPRDRASSRPAPPPGAALVREDEAARAVGRLRLAGREAGLAEERRLLVARRSRRRGTRAPRSSASPTTPLDGTIRGSTSRGHRKRASSSSSHASGSRSSSIVRDALETSVTCTARPSASRASQRVDRAEGKVARERRASSHSSFVAEKYGSGTRPVRSRISSTGSSAQRAAVRRSCQTIAGGSAPVAVPDDGRLALVRDPDRGEVGRADRRRRRSAAAAASTTVCQISSGSCSTQPGRGIVLAELAVAAPERPEPSSTTRQVVPVVPWSIARITGDANPCAPRDSSGYSYWRAFKHVQARGAACRSDRREDACDHRHHGEDDEAPDGQRERNAVLRQRLRHEKLRGRLRAAARERPRSAQ